MFDDADNTCGNPCPVFDRFTNTIWLLMTHNLGKDREADITANKSQGTRTVWVTHSTDDGQTWAAAARHHRRREGPRLGLVRHRPGHRHPDHCAATIRGRLVIPCDQKNNGQFSHVIYSDDRGRSWKLGGKTADGCNECQIVELVGGSLMLSIRPARPPRGDAAESKDKTDAPKESAQRKPPARPGDELAKDKAAAAASKRRKVSTSTDGGITWSEPVEDAALDRTRLPSQHPPLPLAGRRFRGRDPLHQSRIDRARANDRAASRPTKAKPGPGRACCGPAPRPTPASRG